MLEGRWGRDHYGLLCGVTKIGRRTLWRYPVWSAAFPTPELRRQGLLEDCAPRVTRPNGLQPANAPARIRPPARGFPRFRAASSSGSSIAIENPARLNPTTIR